jgi:hypothetical protein
MSITKIQWERLVNKQDRLKKELEMGFELNEKELFDEIMSIERELVLIEN